MSARPALSGAVGDPPAAKALGVAALAVAGGAGLMQLQGRRRVRSRKAGPVPTGVQPLGRRRAREVRELHGAAAMLGLSVLMDSAVEHYRGGFENPGMYTPLITSAMTVLGAGQGAVAGSSRGGRFRGGVYGTAVAVGLVGSGFHVFNLLRRPGGLSWLNLFYSAPLGAPAALSLAGLIGLAAERLARTPPGRPARLVGLPAGRALSALTGLGIAGTVGEAGLLHFRGAFQNPFMFAPVSIPPVAAGLMLKAAAEPSPREPRKLTRAWLGLTALLGLGGVGFHAFGVSRAMGGWRNWSQNVVDGPPLPAPPAFSALALAAMAALSLLETPDG